MLLELSALASKLGHGQHLQSRLLGKVPLSLVFLFCPILRLRMKLGFNVLLCLLFGHPQLYPHPHQGVFLVNVVPFPWWLRFIGGGVRLLPGSSSSSRMSAIKSPSGPSILPSPDTVLVSPFSTSLIFPRFGGPFHQKLLFYWDFWSNLRL